MTALATAPGPDLVREDDRSSAWTPYLLAAVFGVAYTVVSVSRYLNFRTMSFDLGIFEQVVRAYARLDPPVADLKGAGFVIFGDHFSPVTALLAPLYRLAPTPVTLLVAQSALFAASVVPVTRAAKRVLGSGRGAAVGVAYGLSWGLQRAVDFDFHEICFAVPLIALALEALLSHRWRATLAWSLPLVLVKEDLGLTLVVIAGLVACTKAPVPARTRAVALGAAIFGIVACFVCLLVVIPAVNPTGTYGFWSKLADGSAAPAVGSGIGERLETLLWVLAPTTGLLALRSPVLLVAVPTLSWRFVSFEEHYWSTGWHYNAVLMPIVFLALVDALGRTAGSRRRWLRSYAGHLPAMAAAAAMALTVGLPFAKITTSATYEISDRARIAARVLGVIPDNATVEANIAPIAHLTGRCRVFFIGNTGSVVPAYFAYEDTSRTEAAVLDYARALRPGADYDVAARGAGFWVLRLVRR
ncbi:DUF2079 domain-containing protein [Amycolatopsis sp. cmx-4-68]|uniref:DUF2079 domain-containing protein n=1 Tax=Amycolatopsis sp. cmx-4-68 TaxID=2790938 RepID=UPI0039787225